MKEDGFVAFSFFIVCSLCSLIGFIAGGSIAANGLRVEAVKRGAAEWQVNDSGETTFKWKLEPKADSEAK